MIVCKLFQFGILKSVIWEWVKENYKVVEGKLVELVENSNYPCEKEENAIYLLFLILTMSPIAQLVALWT